MVERFFNEEFYLDRNPDVADAVEAGDLEDGLAHFRQFGLEEGRAPAPVFIGFDNEEYLENNSDVQQAVNNGDFKSGLDHFLQFGFEEQRAGVNLPNFDEQFYLNQNPDVARAVERGDFQNGLQHFVQFGLAEGRRGFNPAAEGDKNTPVEDLPFVTQTLTPGNDVVEAPNQLQGEDVQFRAPLVSRTSEAIDQSEVNTLTSSDVIIGGEETNDVLTATLIDQAGRPALSDQGGFGNVGSISPEIRNVEQLVFEAVDGPGQTATVEAASISGVEEIISDRSSDNLTINSLNENAKLVMNRTDGDFTVNFSPTGINNIGDEAVEAEVIGVNDAALTIGGPSNNGIEKLNLSSNEAPSVLSEFDIGNQLRKLTIDGNADLTTKSGDHPNVETIDATEFAGALTLATGGIEEVDILAGADLGGLEINLENTNFTPSFNVDLSALNVNLTGPRNGNTTGLDLSDAGSVKTLNLNNTIEDPAPGSPAVDDPDFNLDGATNLGTVNLEGQPINDFDLFGDAETLNLNLVEDFEITDLQNSGDELTELVLTGDSDLEIQRGGFRNLNTLNLNNFNGNNLVFPAGLSDGISIVGGGGINNFDFVLQNNTTLNFNNASGDLNEVNVVRNDTFSAGNLEFANAGNLQTLNLEDDFSGPGGPLRIEGQYSNLSTLNASDFSDFNVDNGNSFQDPLIFETGGSNEVDITLGKDVGNFTIGLENNFTPSITDNRSQGEIASNIAFKNSLDVELLQNNKTLDLSNSPNVNEVSVFDAPSDEVQIDKFSLVASEELDELGFNGATFNRPLTFNLEGAPNDSELTLTDASDLTFEQFNNNLSTITIGGRDENGNVRTVSNLEVADGNYGNLNTLVVGDGDSSFISGDTLFSTGGSDSIRFQGLVDGNGIPQINPNNLVLNLEDNFAPGLGELNQFAQQNPGVTLPLNVALQSNEITLNLQNASGISQLNVQNAGAADGNPWQFEVTNSGNLETINFADFSSQFRSSTLDNAERPLTAGDGLVLDDFSSLESVDATTLNGLTFDFSAASPDGDSSTEDGIEVDLGSGSNTISTGSNKDANGRFSGTRDGGDVINITDAESENTFDYDSADQAIDGNTPAGNAVDTITGLSNLNNLNQLNFDLSDLGSGLSFDDDFTNNSPGGLNAIFDSSVSDDANTIDAGEAGFIDLLGRTWLVGNVQDGNQFQDGDFLVELQGANATQLTNAGSELFA